MNKVFITTAVLLAVAIITVRCHNTPAEQCPGHNFKKIGERIKVLPCGKKSCTLRKGTNTTVIFKFYPNVEVKDLVNDVYAMIVGIPLPFVGVSGVSACPHVKHADTGEPAPCPLAPNKEYLYTNQFPIQPFYPSVNLRVHWSLKDGDNDVICFEVPAVIK